MLVIDGILIVILNGCIDDGVHDCDIFLGCYYGISDDVVYVNIWVSIFIYIYIYILIII